MLKWTTVRAHITLLLTFVHEKNAPFSITHDLCLTSMMKNRNVMKKRTGGNKYCFHFSSCLAIWEILLRIQPYCFVHMCVYMPWSSKRINENENLKYQTLWWNVSQSIHRTLTYVYCICSREVLLYWFYMSPWCNMMTIHRWNERAESNKEKWTCNQHMKAHINYKQLFRFVSFRLFHFISFVCGCGVQYVCLFFEQLEMQHVILLKFYLQWKWINVNNMCISSRLITLECVALRITVQ